MYENWSVGQIESIILEYQHILKTAHFENWFVEHIFVSGLDNAYRMLRDKQRELNGEKLF